MASTAVARFGSIRSGAAIASRSLRMASASGSATPRLALPSAWAMGKRCKTTMFAESHEYIKMEKKDVGTVGITPFATKSLGDVVFVDLPDVGDTFDAGDSFGSVESVKAASDVYVPAGGEVVEVNEVLKDSPGTVSEDPMGKGWFIKIKIDGDLPDTLMDEHTYHDKLPKDN